MCEALSLTDLEPSSQSQVPGGSVLAKSSLGSLRESALEASREEARAADSSSFILPPRTPSTSIARISNLTLGASSSQEGNASLQMGQQHATRPEEEPLSKSVLENTLVEKADKEVVQIEGERDSL